MHLVQILLPVYDNDGRRFGDERFSEIRRELTGRFGGVTADLRSPATGLWQRDDGTIDRDQMVMVEVMVDRLDRSWWAGYRAQLERTFQQDAIVARAIVVESL
jgi:hypothetical protein